MASQNLGLVSVQMGHYDKAIEYFQTALENAVVEEKVKIQISLLNTYNAKQDAKLAKKYADILATKLPEIKGYTLATLYKSLLDYHKLTGEYKKALFYSEYLREYEEKIAEQESPMELLVAEKDYSIFLKEKKVSLVESQLYFFLISASIFSIIIIVFILLVWRANRKQKIEIQEYIARYDRYRKELHAMRDEHIKNGEEIKRLVDE